METIDARGVRRELRALERVLRNEGGTGSLQSDSIAREMRLSLKQAGAGVQLLMIASYCVFLLGALILIVILDPAKLIATAMVCGAGIIATLFTFYFKLQMINPERLVRLMLEHRQCPACDYNLRSLPMEHDGCTVCPECGAAWRMPREGDDRA